MVLSMYRTLGHGQFVPQFVRIQATDIVGATSYCSFCKLMQVYPQGHLIGATELGEPPSFLFSKTELCLVQTQFWYNFSAASRNTHEELKIQNLHQHGNDYLQIHICNTGSNSSPLCIKDICWEPAEQIQAKSTFPPF